MRPMLKAAAQGLNLGFLVYTRPASHPPGAVTDVGGLSHL